MIDLNPRIVELPSKKTVGIQLSMSVLQNRTAELWASFMPRLNKIEKRSNKEFISLQEYDANYFDNFDPGRSFIKRALVEVTEFPVLPEGMEKYEVAAGSYAVFQYKGLPGDPAVFQYIYGQWLHQSGYKLDFRPHFEVLGKDYKPNSPESEEDIYIPVRPV